MPWVDLDSIHVPSAGNRPPYTWGTTVNANMDVIYDDVLAKLVVWPTWTPTLTQSVTVTKTVNEASYQKLGRIVVGSTHLAVTGAGTAAQAIVVGLPVTAKSFSGTPIIGSFWCYDNSGVIGYQGALVMVTTTTAVGWAHGLANTIGITPNFALANTDQVGYSFTYQAAA